MAAGGAMLVVGVAFAILHGVDEIAIALMAIGSSTAMVGLALFVAS
jgi:hypothetical protein